LFNISTISAYKIYIYILNQSNFNSYSTQIGMAMLITNRDIDITEFVYYALTKDLHINFFIYRVTRK